MACENAGTDTLEWPETKTDITDQNSIIQTQNVLFTFREVLDPK